MDENIDNVEQFKEIEALTDEDYTSFLSTDNLRDFIKIIKQYKPATAEENIRLSRLVKEGNENARELMINKNLRLVLGIALKNQRKLHIYEKLDIIQDGIIGLITAIDKFDENKGAFSTCAIPWICQAIGRGIRQNDPLVRRPEPFIDIRKKYVDLINKCQVNGKPILDDTELCKLLKIKSSTLQLLKDDYKLNSQSLDETVGDEDDTPLRDLVGNEDSGYKGVLSNIVDDELLTFLKIYFSPLDYYIIYYRILSEEKRTQDSIGQEFGVTREYIRQKEVKLVQKMRTFYDRNKNFNAYKSNELNARIGIDDFRTEPLEPSLIAKYLFVRDYCTDYEKIILKELLCGERRNYIRYLSSVLRMDYKEVRDLVNKVMLKVDSLIEENKEFFYAFKQALIATFRTKVLAVDLDMDIEFLKKSQNIIYDFWKDRSYDELLFTLEKQGKSIPNELESKIMDFFNVKRTPIHRPSKLEFKINRIVLGLDKNDDIPRNKLYNCFTENSDKFSPMYKDAILTWFGIMSYRELKRKYSEKKFASKVVSKSYEKILTLYFGFKSYRNYNFNREKYLKIRNKCLLKLEPKIITVLDNFYGYKTGIPMSQQELADSLNISLEEVKPLLRDAKKQAENILLNISNKLTLNLNIYRRFLENNPMSFGEPADTIVRGFFLEEKTYEELAKETNKSTLQVSSYITDAIWKIDSYRFGLVKVFPYPVELMLEALETADFSSELKEEIREYITRKDSTFAAKSQPKDKKFYSYIKQFYKHCLKYITSTVDLTVDEIEKFLNVPHYKTFLTKQELLIAPLLYGIISKNNPSGSKMTIQEIAKEFDIDKDYLFKLRAPIELKLKAYKLGYLKNQLDLMEIEKLEEAINNPHIPLQESDKNILSRIYGLNGNEPNTPEQLAIELKITERSIIRRVMRSIILIKRYENKEIPGNISFEIDIKPLLKYFPKSDQKILASYYRDGLTSKQIAKKHGLTLSGVEDLKFKLRNYINDLQNGEVGFDFDYFWDVIDKDDVPLYGNKSLAVEIFDLYYEKRLGIPEILTVYHPELSDENFIKRILIHTRLAVSKRKEGIKRKPYSSHEEIRDYYLKNHESMSSTPPQAAGLEKESVFETVYNLFVLNRIFIISLILYIFTNYIFGFVLTDCYHPVSI